MYNNKILFTKLKNSLVNTRKKLGDSLFTLFHGAKKIDDTLLSQLEDQLLIADVGVHTAKKIITSLSYRCSSASNLLVDRDVYFILREEMSKILSVIDHSLMILEKKRPFVILVVGVNGVGKTSVIGKLAYHYRCEGRSVVLGAADTFRAAAVEQLKILGAESGVCVISHNCGSDPASVVYDAFQFAKSKYIDVLIIDTAGRLQNKSHLMAELKKIVRVIKKFDINSPDEIMIVLDSTIGQNSVNQVLLFNECIGITGIVMSKLDGTSKGGVLFSIVDRFNIPIRYVSCGKLISDLHCFSVNDFVESIFN
ncbi:signal recognition particle-docking protein FtsY [Blochmannia endosymbiont of Polyrhachis (Hedomyrma) turneri]|uniref:signal recognition particle-docking protein FtsY n=1 Tax=Blochmannia endosymbiont of Polyrhachis (Hedomyrma) turneri TaxID=1505596 RepID=UPI00061A7BEE|nr:signal recognition particle-docking protein FtsY [Blochmannia endosymbiont of Polyrhachis (Hedomyrma) turneri]AKC60182.1 Signal recognition particle receptor FtsY [Blochmannia endosymbiont of Polyrhachis (Hedomyrma) turneri]